MRFEPVFLPPDRVPAGAISMTGLKHYQACPRSGFFYLERKGSFQNVRMLVGSACHEVFERATNLMLAEGEPRIPGDLMKVIVAEVLAESPVPVHEHDRMRELCYRWAEQTAIDPSQTCAVEQLVQVPVGPWMLRCKLDYAELLEGGMAVRVDDYKTSPAAPPYEQLGRRRPGSKPGEPMAGKQFQLVCYALAAAFGEPVRVEGDVETPEPFPLAAGAQRFDLRLVFPAIENAEGGMVTRTVNLTRLELAEYRDSLAVTFANLERSIEAGDWPAFESEEACKECPARRLCPIPAELRDHAGRINDLAELREASEVLERRQDENAALQKEIKAYIKGHGLAEVRFGRSRAWRVGHSESERIENKDRMWEAIERAVEFGAPFNKSEFVRTVESTTLKVVELTPDELAEPEEEE